MGKLRFVGIVGCAWACATAGLPIENDGGSDATVDGSGCPQYNILTDPQHCGSCTNACASGQVCTMGMCKASCDPPSLKCFGSEAGVCIDPTKDPNNCGMCNNTCAAMIPDSGPSTGNGNPDSGIPVPDGGFDAGNGWTFPSSSCDASKCALACAGSSALCSDDLCWDLQNAHDHCGGCTTACMASVEWCTKGRCCPTGQDYCGSACTNVLTDATNCGYCGNVCPVSAPVCISGTCSKQVAISTVCGKSNPSGIFCSGNCTNNHAQYADAYCKLAGYTSAVSYTVLTSGVVNCLYYQTTLPTTCSQVLGPTSYGLNASCDAVKSLTCQ